MRRLSRILLNAGTTVSLGLCVAAGGLWVRSYWVGEAVYSEAPSFRLAILSSKGQCSAFRTSYPESTANGPTRWKYSNRGMWAEVTRRPGLYRADPGVRCYGPVAGFGLFDKPAAPTSTGPATREVFFPYWSLVLLTAARPAAWYARRRRRLRPRLLGLCPACGYDLRATPGRCPECGTVAAQSSHAAALGPDRTPRQGGGHQHGGTREPDTERVFVPDPVGPEPVRQSEAGERREG